MRDVLQISDFGLTYAGGALYEHFQYTFEPGIYVFSGESGVGKTTLMRSIAGLHRNYTGEIQLNGVKITGCTPDVYMMHQHYVSFPWLSVLDNVLMVYKGHKKKITADDRREAIDILGRLGLGEHIGKKPSQISGGQDQRDNIANALINKWSRVFMFDEPTSALDEQNTKLVAALLKEHQQRLNAIFIVISHQNTLIRALNGKVLSFTYDFRIRPA